jgi:hypothetical protein
MPSNQGVQPVTWDMTLSLGVSGLGEVRLGRRVCGAGQPTSQLPKRVHSTAAILCIEPHDPTNAQINQAPLSQ